MTVGELKKIINDCSDEMEIMTYHNSDNPLEDAVGISQGFVVLTPGDNNKMLEGVYLQGN